MLKKEKICFTCLVLVLLLTAQTGCDVVELSEEVPAVIPKEEHEIKTQIFTQEHNNTTHIIYVGDIVQVVLEGNPTTGFTWEVAETDERLLALQGEAEYQSEKNIPGSGGVFTFTFLAQASGGVELKLIYHRTFEEGIAPEREYTLILDIQ
jgi:inhibitor of cysteine peptidase